MTRITSLAALALLTGGCVSSQEAHNGALRLLNAVPDGSQMNLSVDGEVKFFGFDFGDGSAFLALPADSYDVKIDERLPTTLDPNTRNIADLPGTALAVNDELNLIVVGREEAGTVEVLQVPATTTGVATGKTRLQFVHAAVGAPAFDVYVTEPDAVIAASTPVHGNLPYKQYPPPQELNGGNAKVVLTDPGDPDAVRFDSGPINLPTERSLVIAIIPNMGVDAGTRPYALAFWSGSGSTTILDKDTRAEFRLVNASPGSYDLDVFLNDTSVSDTDRQTCDPLTAEDDTLLELCAVPYTSIGAFNPVSPVEPGTNTVKPYELKIQKTGDAAVTPETLVSAFAAGVAYTTVTAGLIADTATTTQVEVLSLQLGRRVAIYAQLRVLDVSIAADNALSGDPTTDRLELYIVPAGTPLDDETADFTGLRFGADTGYFPIVADSYDVTLVRADTATPDAAPEVMLTQQVALADGGLYTLLITDSIPAALPLQYLSIDDAP